MDKFFINGGKRLEGALEISTSKNATLPILAASIMSEGEIIVNKVPNFSDVEIMLKILSSIGCLITKQNNDVIINNDSINSFELPAELTKEVRASIFLMGPLLAKFKSAKLSYPGGCNIGLRPIDLHLNGLRKLGAKIIEQHGYIYCDGKNMHGAVVNLDFPSVGATENLIMAATLIEGTTQIINAAREPEIVDLANFINSMGGKIEGAGNSVITIEGVKKLKGTEYKPIGDRIVAGTYLIAVAMNGGKVQLTNINPDYLISLIDKLKNSACNIDTKFDRIKIESIGKFKALGNIDTQPYPGFPTDLQAPIMAMQTIGEGTTVISENVFESRFKQVPELIRMGATITIKEKSAIIVGEKQLYGAEVTASDLRAGASLVLAGLVAKGYTTINDIYHIDRGYENLEVALSSLGADIKRI
ncbi:MAG: UDP-N-acetylglucosamine 1-carboxyvinyltransferase [Clostridia bacterium]|nr:UDP-N-acetylglucosamine 1-carboxyvinyltransferase [Clostridia bacterium]